TDAVLCRQPDRRHSECQRPRTRDREPIAFRGFPRPADRRLAELTAGRSVIVETRCVRQGRGRPIPSESLTVMRLIKTWRARLAPPRLPAATSPEGPRTAAAAGAPEPAALGGKVRAWRAAHERAIVGELAELVALRNVASDRRDIERNAALLSEMLRKRGLE